MSGGASSAGTLPNLWVVVPAYREARVIGDTVRKLKGVFPNVVVVDDGSPDDTARQALAAGAVVVRHIINLGAGAATQTGLVFALRQGASHVATYDADGQHHVEDLERMCERMAQGDVDVIFGSRFLGAVENMPASRRLLLRLAVIFTNWTTGGRFTDAHNGLRLMTAEVASRIDLLQNGMAHASELVHQVIQQGFRYIEMPVRVTYTTYSLAKGQRNWNALRILGDLLVGLFVR